MPSSTKDPNGILGLDLLFCIVSRYSSLIILAFFNLFLAASKYFLFFSIPQKILPSFFATTAVVPDPKKGSRIKSFLLEEANIIL